MFLEMMTKHFPALTYSRERANYARFKLANQNPADPQPLTYPIQAREQGTIVGYEQIYGLLDCFSIDVRDFRDAFNSHYELTPPVET